MSDTCQFYAKFFNSLANKEVDINSDTFKLLALSSSYNPNRATHQYTSDLTNELSTGSGYTSGGWTLSNVSFSVAYDSGTGLYRWKMTCDPLSMSGSTALCRYLVVADTTPSSKPLVCLISFKDDSGSGVDKMPQTFAANVATGALAYIDFP